MAAAAAAAGVAGAQSLVGVPMITGSILWPDHDLTKAQVRLYRDRAMTDLYDIYPASAAGGAFVAIVEPGEFYLMAIADLNGNDKLDTGDGLGYFGVSVFDPATQAPRGLRVPRDGLVSDVQIPVTATIDAAGKPVPLEGAPTPVTLQPRGLSVAVRGRVADRFEFPAPVFVVLVAAADGAPVGVARVGPDADAFALEAAPGAYRLLALVDLAEDGSLGPGDRIGAYGVDDWSEAPAALSPLELDGSRDLDDLLIAPGGRIRPEGRVTDAAGAGEFRLDLAALPAILCAKVLQPQDGHRPAQVRISADPGLGESVGVAPVDPETDAFVTALPAGTYYLTALVDANEDGSFGPGDLIGFHGVTDLRTGAAQPVTLEPAAIRVGVEIAVVGRVSEEGGLSPLEAQPTAEGTT
ncbi:MAG: hypothetical protein FJX74_09645, partial [Armatimonadetes bacterium]|nr:hypothetical protein [Armatimonadota bacterium]